MAIPMALLKCPLITLITLALMFVPIAWTQQQLPLPTANPVPGSTGDSRPSPDPTRLTTEQLIRELNSLREILTARLDANDKERTSLANRLDKIPDMIEKRVHGLQALNEERFSSITLQFKERDTRTEQASRDNKAEVATAFQAAKEAVNTAFSSAKEAVAAQQASASLAIAKSEAGTSKQIDQLANLFDTSMKGLGSKVDDLKSRLGTIEGLGAGSRDYRESSQASLGSILGIIAAVISALALAVAVFFHMNKKP